MMTLEGKPMNDTNGKLANYFEHKLGARPVDSPTGCRRFVTLRENAPQWVLDAVREAHMGSLPLDWIFAECLAVAERIDEGDFDEDGDWIHEHADNRVDIYTAARFHWAAEFCLTSLFANAEADARELSPGPQVGDMLGLIQYCAITNIVATFFNACVKAGAV